MQYICAVRISISAKRKQLCIATSWTLGVSKTETKWARQSVQSRKRNSLALHFTSPKPEAAPERHALALGQAKLTRERQWHRSKHARGIVHVQALLVKHQIHVCLGQVIHSIPEMEVETPTGHTAGEGWEAPCCGIMTMQLQLSIQSACASELVYGLGKEVCPAARLLKLYRL